MTFMFHKDTNKSQNLPATWDNLFCLPKFVSRKITKMVNLYFDKYIGAPLAYSFFPAQYSLGNQLVEEGYNIALIGVKSEMNAGNPGSESAPGHPPATLCASRWFQADKDRRFRQSQIREKPLRHLLCIEMRRRRSS